ncbi:hypothetical protein V3C99_013816 [Haemonchus contortus]|uniref:DUF5641 domain-containing protein n=1 Tax=Haemonchus contortus TaxID=6289 RepID=A0A7I4YS74_HAECO
MENMAIQYLISLRESHQLDVKSRKGDVYSPRKGNLVLICEAQPRHSWKIGSIEKLCPNTQGIIREAVVRLPSRRRIRRPINLLIPLELEATTSNEMDLYEDWSNIASTSSHSSSRCNLRQG